jgi:hypothetical protein
MSLFNRGILVLSNGDSTWDGGGDIEIMLMGTAFSFNRDSDFVADISANEISTTNYARQNVATRTTTLDDTNDRVVYDAADNLFTALGPASGGPTVGSCVHERNTGSDATSPLINHLDFTDTTVNGGNFTVQYAATGCILGTSP